MAQSVEIFELLRSAQSERSGRRAAALLEAALAKCQEWEQTDQKFDALLLKAQVLESLAYEQNSGKARADYWKRALKALTTAARLSPHAAVADLYGSIAVDAFQDTYSEDELSARLEVLRRARDMLSEAIRIEVNNGTKSNLLARKSSILRHLSIGDVDDFQRIRRLDEAVACAGLAVNLSRCAPTILELGLSEWARSRYESTDQGYVNRLREAEVALTDKQLDEFELGQLALARFYRMTFRPGDACRVYRHFSSFAKNVRRLLRDAFIYGEAAVQLWYREYPAAVLNEHLPGARNLLEQALAAGYRDARSITTLADTVAILDGADSAKLVLGELTLGQQNVSWEAALKLVAGVSQSELVALGFALGIDQAAVWTHVGTFAWRFLGDRELAGAMYREAVQLDSRSPIALTNLARYLIRLRTGDALSEAGRLLQKAEQFSDRRFTWWRQVLAELKDVQPKTPATSKRAPLISAKPLLVPSKSAVTLKEIRKRFKTLQRLDDTQARGRALERLFEDLAALTFDLATGPTRIRREGGYSQYDGYFELVSTRDRYRVECKWESRLTDHTDITLFRDKLDVVGTSGLFVSMSGFSDSAIGRAREYRGERAILLMDGQEASAVFLGEQLLDEVMRQKQSHFYQLSNPYFRVLAHSEAA